MWSNSMIQMSRPSGKIDFQAAPGTTFPSDASDYWVEDENSSRPYTLPVSGVTTSAAAGSTTPNAVEIQLPGGSQQTAGGSVVKVFIGAVRNPSTAGAYTMLAWTGTQTTPIGSSYSISTTPSPTDALTDAVVNKLNNFVNWLQTYNVKGYVGEIGWPNTTVPYGFVNSAVTWNVLAENWYEKADAANLWVTPWTTGEMYGSLYKLTPYDNGVPLLYGKTAVSSAESQSSIIQMHPTTPNYLRGVNSSGGEWGYASTDAFAGDKYNNQLRGEYGVDWQYDSQATFDYVASRGIKLIRLPFRWERLQPTLGGPLDSTALAELQAAVSDIHAAGMQVILDMHNYGGYYAVRNGPSDAPRQDLGSAGLPISDFVDVWTKLSQAFKNDATVVGYDLMNEPAPTSSGSGGTPQTAPLLTSPTWQQASQAALSGIRSNGDSKVILVEGFLFAGIGRFGTSVEPTPWITDPMNNMRYEAHQYWDCGQGLYNDNYTTYESIAESGPC
jgi:hypothetical protein